MAMSDDTIVANYYILLKIKAHNITVERLHCPSPRNVFSVIDEQTKELDRNQVHGKSGTIPISHFFIYFQR